MDPGRRFLLAGLAVAGVHVVLAVVALRTGLAPYFLACAGATVGLAVVARRLLIRPSDDDPGDGRGGAGRGPDEPPEPPWWPQFEDDLREYARDRQPVH